MDEDGQHRPAVLTENQFVLLRSDTEEKKTLLGRYHEGRVTALEHNGVKPSA